MRIVYSEKVNNLFDLIEPYIEWDKFPAKLKEDAPENIKRAESLYRELMKKEKMQYLKDSGII